MKVSYMNVDQVQDIIDYVTLINIFLMCIYLF